MVSRRWKNAAYWLIFNLGGRAMGLARSTLIARFLSAELASLGFLALSIGSLACAALSTGTTQVVVAAPHSDRTLLSAAWGLELVKGLGLGVLLLLAGGFAHFLDLGFKWQLVCAASLIPISMAFVNPAVYLWERQGDHGRVTIVTGSGAVFGAVLCALMLIFFPTWWVVPASAALGNVGAAALSHLWGIRHSDVLAIRWQRVRAMFKQGMPYLTMGLATYFSSLGIDLALGIAGAVEWVAPFRFAMSLVYAVLSVVPGVILRAALSADADRFRSGTASGVVEPHAATLLIIVATTALLVPLCSLVLPHVALLLYGSKWAVTGQLIPSLCGLAGVRMLSRPLGNVFLSLGEPKLEARAMLWEALVSTSAIGMLAARDPILGIHVGTGAAGVALLFRLMALRRRGARLATSAVTTGAGALGVVATLLVGDSVPGLATLCVAAPALVLGAARWLHAK